MKFTKLKHEPWLLVIENGECFYGKSKKDCLSLLEEWIKNANQ